MRIRNPRTGKLDYTIAPMDEAALSRVWQQLLDGEIDILVCTTLIETGVDVRNCNTLIIEDADRMGLAQLYQIRGRVGRSGLFGPNLIFRPETRFCAVSASED